MSLASYSSIKGPQNKTSGPSNPSFGASCIQIPQRWVGTIPGSDKSGTDLEGDGKLLRSLNVPEALQPKKHQTSIKSVKKRSRTRSTNAYKHITGPKKTHQNLQKNMENTWKNPSSPSIFLCLLSLEFHPLDLPLGGHLRRLGLGLRTGLWMFIVVYYY